MQRWHKVNDTPSHEQLASKRMGYREVLKGVLEGVNILQRQAQALTQSYIDEHL